MACFCCFCPVWSSPPVRRFTQKGATDFCSTGFQPVPSSPLKEQGLVTLVTKMNFKTTLVLLVLLAALGTVLLYVRNKQSNEPETPTPKKLIEIDQKDVSKIII